MKKLPISEIQPGAVVARAVTTSSGVVLVQPGTALTPEIVARLDALHVEAVWLAGQASDAKPVEEQLAELDRRFAGHEQNELMMQLKAIVASTVRQGAAESCDG